MWTRQELKAKGKAAFKRNYWKCVLASVVAILLLGAAAGTRASGGGGSLEEFQADLNAAASQAGISQRIRKQRLSQRHSFLFIQNCTRFQRISGSPFLQGLYHSQRNRGTLYRRYCRNYRYQRSNLLVCICPQIE